jgi:hypothetical protein
VLALSALACLGAPASRALGAEFSIPPGGFTVEMLDAEGHPEALAGAHPDLLLVSFSVVAEETSVRDLELDLPGGLGGSPNAVPLCPRTAIESEEECPAESQVGRFEAVLPDGQRTRLPLYEAEPEPGQPIDLQSKSFLDLPFSAEIRSADFGVTFKANDLPEESIVGGTFELWGVPADHQVGTGIPRRPFLTTPATCGPLDFAFRTRSWQEGAPWLSAVANTGVSLGGCEQLHFAPRLGVTLSDPLADSPTGMRMDLVMPPEDEASERADAPIQDATVEFPAGIGVSPGGAVGIVACSDAEVGLGNDAEPHCPPQSRIGSAEFSSDILTAPVLGTVYIGQERPGQRLRSFLVASGAGVTIKSVATLQVNPSTGRLSTTMHGLPQVPIQRISLSFDGGPHALLASPLDCGTATALASFQPYGGGPTVDSSASVSIAARPLGSPCTAAPFAPQLTTSSTSHRAGHTTTFATTLRRQAGEQLTRRFSTTLPAGLSMKLGDIKACPDAAANAAACPDKSRVGSVRAELGPSPNPAVLQGGAYLTGSYRRAPLGILMQFRASIGAFDFGAVSVRAAARLDPHTGRLTVSSDTLPEQIEGVQLRFQSIELSMGRPGLLRNPTSCSPSATNALFESQAGAFAASTSPLALRGCKRLPFRPSMQLALTGRGELHKHGTPALRLTTKLRPGDANLLATKSVLPPIVTFGIGGLAQICSRQDAGEGNCPPGARVGSARARSPLLKEPMRGAVYAVQPSGNGPPDLWASVGGEGIDVRIRSRSFLTRDGRFATRQAGLPDIPLSSFTMRLGGGSARVISLAVDPCRRGAPRRFASDVIATGQNGARRALRVPIAIQAPCSAGAG